MAYTRAQLNGEDLKDFLDALNAVVYVDENGKLITDDGTEDMENVCCWATASRHDERWQAVDIEWFMARGMRRVYRRVEGFGHLHLTMDVWYTRDGRLLARFWSRSEETDPYAYEVKGFVPPECDGELGENWAPRCLREGFGNWVLSEMPYVYSGLPYSIFG